MSSLRTQIYLTREQRRKLDRRAEQDGTSLAHLIREAVDRYLESQSGDVDDVLRSTFGSIPDLEIPDRAEWDRGNG